MVSSRCLADGTLPIGQPARPPETPYAGQKSCILFLKFAFSYPHPPFLGQDSSPRHTLGLSPAIFVRGIKSYTFWESSTATFASFICIKTPYLIRNYNPIKLLLLKDCAFTHPIINQNMHSLKRYSCEAPI